MKNTMLTALTLATFLALPGLAAAEEKNPLELLQNILNDSGSVSYSTKGELDAQVIHQEKTKISFSEDGCSIALRHSSNVIASVAEGTEMRTNSSTGHLRLDTLQASAVHVYIGMSCESLSLTSKPEASSPGGCLYVVAQEKSGRTLLNKDLVFKFHPSDREAAVNVARQLSQAIRTCQQDEVPIPGTVRVDEGRGVKYTEALSGTPNRQTAQVSMSGSSRSIR